MALDQSWPHWRLPVRFTMRGETVYEASSGLSAIVTDTCMPVRRSVALTVTDAPPSLSRWVEAFHGRYSIRPCSSVGAAHSVPPAPSHQPRSPKGDGLITGLRYSSSCPVGLYMT